MVLALATLVPTALALFLVAFGNAGRLDAPTRRHRSGAVLVGALVLGPLAVSLLGLVGWLVMVALAAAALTAVALLRVHLRARRASRRHVALR